MVYSKLRSLYVADNYTIPLKYRFFVLDISISSSQASEQHERPDQATSYIILFFSVKIKDFVLGSEILSFDFFILTCFVGW